MDQLGPAWTNAQFNAFYYASYWVTPLILAFGATSRTWRRLWLAAAGAFIATFLMAYWTWQRTWAVRSELAESDLQQEIVANVQAGGISGPLAFAAIFALGMTAVWTLGAAAIFWTREWFERSRRRPD